MGLPLPQTSKPGMVLSFIRHGTKKPSPLSKMKRPGFFPSIIATMMHELLLHEVKPVRPFYATVQLTGTPLPRSLAGTLGWQLTRTSHSTSSGEAHSQQVLLRSPPNVEFEKQVERLGEPLQRLLVQYLLVCGGLDNPVRHGDDKVQEHSDDALECEECLGHPQRHFEQGRWYDSSLTNFAATCLTVNDDGCCCRSTGRPQMSSTEAMSFSAARESGWVMAAP